MKKHIYEHKETGKKVVTSEKLDSKHWKKVGEWRTGQMEANKVRTKHGK